jgi:hypothetical protein
MANSIGASSGRGRRRGGQASKGIDGGQWSLTLTHFRRGQVELGVGTAVADRDQGLGPFIGLEEGSGGGAGEWRRRRGVESTTDEWSFHGIQRFNFGRGMEGAVNAAEGEEEETLWRSCSTRGRRPEAIGAAPTPAKGSGGGCSCSGKKKVNVYFLKFMFS